MGVFLTIIWVLAGVSFIISLLLMSPKGGLGVWVAGMGWWGEYGSKKSIEGTLKKTTIVAFVVFIIASIFLPYVD